MVPCATSRRPKFIILAPEQGRFRGEGAVRRRPVHLAQANAAVGAVVLRNPFAMYRPQGFYCLTAVRGGCQTLNHATVVTAPSRPTSAEAEAVAPRQSRRPAAQRSQSSSKNDLTDDGQSKRDTSRHLAVALVRINAAAGLADAD
jgi:hypothetical protein